MSYLYLDMNISSPTEHSNINEEFMTSVVVPRCRVSKVQSTIRYTINAER